MVDTSLPLPPHDFEHATLEVVDCEIEQLVRLAWPDPKTHVRFGRDPVHRFDAPDGRFGVLYSAFNVLTCFVETVYRDKPATTPARERVVLSESRELAPRRVVQLVPVAGARRLRLIRLVGSGLAAARTDGRLCTVDAYAITQQWAQALHAHPEAADGLVYVSRYLAGEGESVALFDRCAALIGTPSVVPLLEHAEFALICDALQFGTAP